MGELREKLMANGKSLMRTFLSIFILLAYLFLNAASATSAVLCLRQDGHVSLKLNSCQPCCVPDLDQTFESCAEDSCCPCSDIPVSSCLSQFCSREVRDSGAFRLFAANTSNVFSILKPTAREFIKLQKIADKNQVFSLLRSVVLLL